MIQVAIDYYKTLSGHEDRIILDLKLTFSDEEKVSVEEIKILSKPLTEEEEEEEVMDTVFGSYGDGAPRPDGLSFMFYQTF
jgi:hypothetical protein